MDDGNYTFYAIQFRRTHESPWLKPKGKLSPVKKKDTWGGVGPDSWGGSIDPHIGSGNEWRARNKRSSDQLFSLRMKTGIAGWYDLKYAIAALKRLKKDSANGKHDGSGPYREHTQAIRYEFRINIMTMSKTTRVLTCDDILEAA